MKKVFMMTRIVLMILCLAMVFISPLSASAEDNKEDQGYFILPDDIEHIRKDVLSGISKTKARLQDEVNQKSNVTGIQENVLVNRLDDEKILTEDDHELVLIYEVEYTYEEEATRSPITSDYKIDSAYYSWNNLVINLSVRMDYYTDWGYVYEGHYPRKIYKSTYSFNNASTYLNYRLGVDSISWGATQFGLPYGGSTWWALQDYGSEEYPPFTFSDSHTEYHYPVNWTLMVDGQAGGYGTVFGDFDISCYKITPPYDIWDAGETTRQVNIGSTAN